MVSKLRKPEIKIWQKIGVDKDTYFLLREQKKIQLKSMMRIVKDLIFDKYGRNM